jgi:electron transport complex protein RnfC
MSIVIENDYNDELFEGIKPVDRFHSIDAQELADIAEAAGIVGLGGAMFPTHVKISSSVGKVDTLIINGAECEPYITSDNRQMLECGEEIINGVTLLMKALKLDTAYIAIESNKRSAIEKIRRLIAKKDGLKLKVLRTKYPQGAEKQLIKSVCGREVPPGGLPSAVGVLNINVGTVIALSRAVETGMPLLTKVVTVSGSAVANPKNLLARIGTPLRELFSAAGGFKDNPYKVLMGGPMMGISQYSLDVPVIKGTNAILAFCEKEDAYSEQQVCIRCGKCVGACPMNLMPVYLHMYGNRGMLDECEKLNVTDCIECGCCSYICPGRLHLVQSFKNTKQRLAALKKKKGAR